MSTSLWLRQLHRRLFGLPSSSSGRKPTSAGARRRVRPCLEALEDRLVPAVDSVQTVAANVSAPFSESSQNLNLTATVTDTTNSSTTVNEGQVTFTVKDSGGVAISSPVIGNVNNGTANAAFTLPANEPAGNYTIAVTYDDGASPNFADGGDTSGTLAVNAASTTTAASNATATFSSSTQNVTLNATVTSSAGPVNEGSVTFTLVDSQGHTVGTATSDSVANGSASVSYTLPAGTTAGSYTINASYTDSSGNFAASSDNTHTLTVSGATTTTTAQNATTTFNGSGQSVTLSATVTSGTGTVNEGNVLFTLFDHNGNIVGSTTTGAVRSGNASVSYALPAGTAAGSYTINASYTDSAGNFATSSDNTHTLAVNAASTTTTAQNATATFNSSAQSVTLNATVSSRAGTVNEGQVTFLVFDSNANLVGSVTSGPISNGQASVNYALPAGLAPGTYSISANFNDSAGNFAISSDSGKTLTVSPASSGSISLVSATITPNLSNGNAQVTLTARVTNAAGVVNEGVLSFTLGNVTGQATVSNGMATVQLTVPLQTVMAVSTVSLSYSDTAPTASFTSASGSATLSANFLTALLPSSVTVGSDGSEQISLNLSGQSLLSFVYNAAGLPIQINTSSGSIPVTYTNLGGSEIVSIGGVPWQWNVFNSSGQLIGLTTLSVMPDGTTQWLIVDSSGNIVGALPS